MVEGTENKVDNFVGKHTVAELHNHPNGTPPSFQDVLYTAKQAADTAIIGYKATFVYNAKDDSFYALYVHDRDKAARFYEEIKDQIDSETMMFKRGSAMQKVLSQKGVDKGPVHLKEQLSAVFGVMECGMSLYKIDKKSITSYDIKRKYNKEGKEINKIIFTKCS